METKEQRPEQADLPSRARRLDRHTRGPLGTLMLVAFIGYAFMYFVVFFYALLVAKAFIPPIAIEASLILLAAGVVATRWRWAPQRSNELKFGKLDLEALFAGIDLVILAICDS